MYDLKRIKYPLSGIKKSQFTTSIIKIGTKAVLL